MKKLIFLILLIPIFYYSQININKVCSFNENEAKDFANEIIKFSEDKFRFYKKINDENSETFIYVPIDISNDEINKQGYGFYNKIEVSFEIYYKNSNVDLNQKGVKTYRLKMAYGKFLNLFNFWKTYYSSSITKDNYKDYKLLEYRKDNLLIKFIDNDNGEWYITSFWCP